MELREVKAAPGFLKIVDEILINAADNKVRVVMLCLTQSAVYFQLRFSETAVWLTVWRIFNVLSTYCVFVCTWFFHVTINTLDPR